MKSPATAGLDTTCRPPRTQVIQGNERRGTCVTHASRAASHSLGTHSSVSGVTRWSPPEPLALPMSRSCECAAPNGFPPCKRSAPGEPGVDRTTGNADDQSSLPVGGHGASDSTDSQGGSRTKKTVLQGEDPRPRADAGPHPLPATRHACLAGAAQAKLSRGPR